MSESRRYRLLCPIARALDRIGDRWTLLILRDLHAGPARFSDLLTGLNGIASNLLTNRLRQLAEDGLVRRRKGEFGVLLYELTELGARTDELLFELALFGGLFSPEEPLRRPGNLRTVAVTMKTAFQRVADPRADVTAEMSIDGERFTIRAKEGRVDVKSGACEAPDVRMTTRYEPMMAAGDGRMSMEEFTSNHVEASAEDPEKLSQLFDLFARAIALFDARRS